MTHKIKVATRSELPLGRSKTFQAFGQHGLLINDGGVLRAYVNRCTHMGGPTELVTPERLRCRWHLAEFDAHTGAAIEGEAPRGTRLSGLPVAADGDDVYVLWELRDDFDF